MWLNKTYFKVRDRLINFVTTENVFFSYFKQNLFDVILKKIDIVELSAITTSSKYLI